MPPYGFFFLFWGILKDSEEKTQPEQEHQS